MVKLAKYLSIWFILLLLLAPAAYADWREARSENFIFVGDVSEKRAREAVEELEIFRTSIFRIFGWTYGTETIPVRVFGARSDRQIRVMTGRSRIAGVYTTDYEGPAFILNMSNRGEFNDASDVAFHEFVHHLTNTYGRLRFPTWYNEGFAEYFSTFDIRRPEGTRTRISFGAPSEGRAWSIVNEREYDWDDFISAVRGYPSNIERATRGRTFYAQAWLAAHFIQSTQGYSEKLSAYLNMLHTPDAPEDAFERTFEMTPDAFGSLLDRYFKRNKYTTRVVTFDDSFRIPEITTRELSKGEERFYRGEALRIFHSSNREDETQESTSERSDGRIAAEAHYEKAMDAGGSATQINTSRALIALSEEDYVTAIDTAAAAAVRAPEDSRVLYVASLAHYGRYTEEDTLRLDEDKLAARTYSLRAMQANPDNIGAHFIHALSFAASGDTPSAQAVYSARQSSVYYRGENFLKENLLLAKLLAEGEQYTDARWIFEDIQTWSQSASARRQAQRAIDHLNTLDPSAPDTPQEASIAE